MKTHEKMNLPVAVDLALLLFLDDSEEARFVAAVALFSLAVSSDEFTWLLGGDLIWSLLFYERKINR